MQEYCPTEPGAHHLDLWCPARDPRVAHLGSNAERPAERRMRSATSWPRYRVVAPSTQVGAATRGYQSVTRKRGHNAFAAAVIFDSKVARQIVNSWTMPRKSISRSRPCTAGRAKCQVKPPGVAARRTISSAKSGWM